MNLYVTHLTKHLFFNPHPRAHLLILERGDQREREGEKHWCEEETLANCLWYTPRLETSCMCPHQEPNWQQACALTGNWIHNLSVYRTTLQPSEPHQPRKTKHNALKFFCIFLEHAFLLIWKGWRSSDLKHSLSLFFYYLSLCLSSSLSFSVRRLFLCSFLTLKISHQSSPVLFPFPTLTTTRYICFFLWTSQCKLIKLISMTPDSPLIHRLDYGQQRCFSSERNEWKPLNSHIHIVPVI